jgi:para-nitrobenzyl esterase
MSEDCLSLNVWAPERAAGKGGLPVYVFIHGGGFAAGSSGQPRFGLPAFLGDPGPLYGGEAFARAGVILVTLNYRLGALGFLALEESLKEHGTAGNWGLWDQIEALRWVKANIRAFGGDPDNVTVGGESAGAVCASILALSPAARGLFRGAVMESGTALSLPGFPVAKGYLAVACSLGASFLRLLGLPSGPRGLEALRRADPRALARLSALDFDFRRLSPMAFSPVADGAAVPKDPHAELAAGRAGCASFLLGFNRDEGSLFLPRERDPQVLAAMEQCFLGPEGLEAFARACPQEPGRREPPWARTRRAIAYALFTAGARRFADLASRAAGVFLYRFDHAPPAMRLSGLGACHALELPFVFGTAGGPGLLSGYGTRDLSALMNSRWAAFVKTGSPGPAGAGPGGDVGPPWPRYSEQARRCLVFSRRSREDTLPDSGGLAVMAEAFFGKLPARGRLEEAAGEGLREAPGGAGGPAAAEPPAGKA